MENFSETIEKWYAGNQRDLPWRHAKDPYSIWISEIILQQTQVKQGYGYYLRFIKRFPNVFSLARADEQEVLKYWQGLGYYSRARNLHAAAKHIVNDLRGHFPSDYRGVRALKGVGDYTAAAICSFAYGLPEAVLDGNVYRVLARYFAISTPIDTTEGKKLFTELSRKMLDKRQPALYNQAIMDFGAVQCTPANPTCLFCPLQDSCLAFSEGQVTHYPIKARKTRTKDVYYTYLYINCHDRFLLHKRSGAGIWKNLYELPLIESTSAKEQENILSSTAFREWTKISGTSPLPTIRLVAGDLRHVLSHRIIHAQCFAIILQANASDSAFTREARQKGCIAISRKDLEHYPLPRLITRILEKTIDGSGTN